jgi:hypothetical protein
MALQHYLVEEALGQVLGLFIGVAAAILVDDDVGAGIAGKPVAPPGRRRSRRRRTTAGSERGDIQSKASTTVLPVR